MRRYPGINRGRSAIPPKLSQNLTYLGSELMVRSAKAMRKTLFAAGLALLTLAPKPKVTPSPTGAPGPSLSKAWAPDNGDGTYKNPVLHADYSDPDVIRVGKDFYLVASSFNSVPGIPVLHSRDL